nr:hypothetical protein [Tanacetum cinerariifolium]
MAHPVQNINHSAFRSMFEREKLSGNNFNDWFRQLKLVLRVKKKIFVIEQPIPPAPAANSATNVLAKWNALYAAHNKVACLMLGNQLERLGYVLPQDLTVGLILNGLTKDFARFVRNYNTHNMGKMIDELHAMLIEYEKSLLKKAETPQVRMIKGGRIQKSNKKSLKAKSKGKTNGKGKDKQVYIPKPAAKEHPAKDNTCHPTRSNGIIEIDMHDLVPNVNSIYNVSTKRAKHNLDSTYLWHFHLAHISKKRIKKLQHEGFLKSTNDESFDHCVSCLSGKMNRKSFPHRLERVTGLLGIIHTHVCGLLRHGSRHGASYFITFTDDYSRYGYIYLLKHKHEVFETFKVFKIKVENQLEKIIKALRSDRGYPKETMGYYFYFSPENKIVVARYAEFFERNLITQEVSGRAIDLEEIPDENTSPSEITSKIPMEVKGFEPP